MFILREAFPQTTGFVPTFEDGPIMPEGTTDHTAVLGFVFDSPGGTPVFQSS